MIQPKYSAQIYRILSKNLEPVPRIFIFGSSLKTKSFADVDVGLVGEPIAPGQLVQAKEALEESTLPYKVDLVDFNQVNDSFKQEVLNGTVQWLT